MLRLSGVFFILIAFLCAVLLFQTSQSVQSLEGDLADVLEQNQKETDAIRVLATEWDYLNNPQRLERLVNGKEFQPNFNFTTEVDKIPEPTQFVVPEHKPRLIKYGVVE